MFLENGFLSTNKFWKYLVGSLLIFIASTIGQIPWVIAVLIKSFKTGKPFPTTETTMMTFLNLNATLFLLLFSFFISELKICWNFFDLIKYLGIKY